MVLSGSILKSQLLSTHSLFSLLLDSSKIFQIVLVIAITFLSFKGTAHAYLLKLSMPHNKIPNSLLYLLINCMSSRKRSQTLSLKDLYFSFFKFSNSQLVQFFC